MNDDPQHDASKDDDAKPRPELEERLIKVGEDLRRSQQDPEYRAMVARIEAKLFGEG